MTSRKPATTPPATAPHTASHITEHPDQAIHEAAQRIVEIRAHYAAAVECGDGAAMWRLHQQKELVAGELAELAAASSIRGQQAVVHDLDARLAQVQEAAAAAKRDAEDAIAAHQAAHADGGVRWAAAREKAQQAILRSSQAVHVPRPLQIQLEAAQQALQTLIDETARRIG